jgi:hypothetical protein
MPSRNPAVKRAKNPANGVVRTSCVAGCQPQPWRPSANCSRTRRQEGDDKGSVAAVALVAWAAASLSTQVASTAVSRADDVACPVGMYWDIYSNQCLFYDVDVYLNPNPILGPLGPVGVGGVIGPVGPGPVGPGVVGPGPVGPGPVGPGPAGPGRAGRR